MNTKLNCICTCVIAMISSRFIEKNPHIHLNLKKPSKQSSFDRDFLCIISLPLNFFFYLYSANKFFLECVFQRNVKRDGDKIFERLIWRCWDGEEKGCINRVRLGFIQDKRDKELEDRRERSCDDSIHALNLTSMFTFEQVKICRKLNKYVYMLQTYLCSLKEK